MTEVEIANLVHNYFFFLTDAFSQWSNGNMELAALVADVETILNALKSLV